MRRMVRGEDQGEESMSASEDRPKIDVSKAAGDIEYITALLEAYKAGLEAAKSSDDAVWFENGWDDALEAAAKLKDKVADDCEFPESYEDVRDALDRYEQAIRKLIEEKKA